jgi:hypothetical protein
MKQTYQFPMPQAEAMYEARCWEMDKSERDLLAFVIGMDLDPSGDWYGDNFHMENSHDYWAFHVQEDGCMYVWCPDVMSDIFDTQHQCGNWYSVDQTDFRERFNRGQLGA